MLSPVLNMNSKQEISIQHVNCLKCGPSSLTPWFQQSGFAPATEKKLNNLDNMFFLSCMLTRLVLAFFTRTPFKLISSWFSRFWRSLMLNPEISSPRSFLQPLESHQHMRCKVKGIAIFYEAMCLFKYF